MSAPTSDGSTTCTRRRASRRYTRHRPAAPSAQQEQVFLNMKHRQLERDLRGHQKKSTSKHLIALFILLLLVFGVGATYFSGSQFTTTLTLKTWQIATVGFWFLISVGILNAFSESGYFPAVVWMLVYWPLVAIVCGLIFYGNANFASTVTDTWILAAFITAEVVTFLVTIGVHWLYPKIICSEWFRERIGARFWKVQVVTDWTMTYNSGYRRRRHTCRYQGEFNEQGLPHGMGKWTDDAYGGEILTGKWKDGVPVAPFVSRQYGTGDAFRCVPIAYFAASDDSFAENKLVPTNEQPARCGVANVECSVQGAFLKNLPNATQELYGPHTVVDGQEGELLAECFSHMPSIHTERAHTSLEIRASDPRGIEVLGHVYKRTGLPLATEPTQIVIDIERENDTGALLPFGKSDDFMPFSSFASKEQEYVLVLEEEEDGREAEEAVKKGEGIKMDAVDLHTTDEKQSVDLQMKVSNNRKSFARLEVQDWISTPHKAALVFFPGFNSHLKKSLHSFGQFMAMTKTMDHVHPVIFAWPNGQVLTYRNASAISHSTRNKELLLQLIRGLALTGIRHVHFLSHSMGVQSLLGAFEDKDDGSRSDVSECFRLNHSFATGDEKDDKLMICKSITMVNPDFPIEAFVDHAFLSIRRICDHVTIVGDRQDGALYYSQIMNGAFKCFGYEQPKILNKDGKEVDKKNKSRAYHPQNVVGRDIERIYLPLPDPQRGEDEEKASLLADERLLFKGAPAVILSPDGQVQEHLWLDVDVIDTTQLDTNIKDLRHSGFNVNPILLKDLEELVVTGRRAAQRSTLLFREGNIYSYCHAPSFVTM